MVWHLDQITSQYSFLMMVLYVYSILRWPGLTYNSGKLSEYIKALLEEGKLLSAINLADLHQYGEGPMMYW